MTPSSKMVKSFNGSTIIFGHLLHFFLFLIGILNPRREGLMISDSSVSRLLLVPFLILDFLDFWFFDSRLLDFRF